MKGALTVAGGVFIHVALGVLFTFGEYELAINLTLNSWR